MQDRDVSLPNLPFDRRLGLSLYISFLLNRNTQHEIKINIYFDTINLIIAMARIKFWWLFSVAYNLVHVCSISDPGDDVLLPLCVSEDAGNHVIQHSTLPPPSQGPLSCHTHLPATLAVASAPFLPFQYLIILLYLSFLPLSYLRNKMKLYVISLHNLFT